MAFRDNRGDAAALDPQTVTPSKDSGRLSMTQVLVCAAAIVTLSMGIRHGFGLWLQPITLDRGWTRETFAFALAIQNLAWGLAGPLAGMVADRFGAFAVLVVGGLLYGLGLVAMGLATSGLAFTGSAGVLLGIAQSGTTYAVVYGVIARNVDPAKRSWAMGVTAAAGSFGQFLMVPVENWLIGGFGWQNALFVLGCAALAIMPLAFGLKEPDRGAGGRRSAEHRLSAARSLRLQQLSPADGRLFRLRLPGRVHRRAHAELSAATTAWRPAWRPQRWR